MTENVRQLAAELTGRGRVLEVGVGTGLLGLPLAARGLPLAGVDLSGPMLHELTRKSGGRPPFPLVMGDATALPFADGSFGGAYLRWVLHLIPNWAGALAEMDRVVGAQGVLIINLGANGGVRGEIHERFSELTGIPIDPVGLGWGDTDALDAALRRVGRQPRLLQPIIEQGEESIGGFLDDIRENRYSWTWRVPDELLHSTAEELRRWAADRWEDLDEPRPFSFTTRWRAYDSTT